MNSVPPPFDSIISQVSSSSGSHLGETDAATDDPLSEGEVMRIALYQEIPTLDRQTVVREKVQIKNILMPESADSQP